MTATLAALPITPGPTREVVLRDAVADEVSRWDTLVRRFGNHRVTHTRAWIESLHLAGCGDPLYLVFARGSEIVGCLPGLVTTIAGCRLFGSPLEGWQTASMGPAFDPERLDTQTIVGLLLPYLASQHRVRHVELMHSGLDERSMERAGFRGEIVPTFRAPLASDEAGGFATLKRGARQNVRRAERLGIEIRFGVDRSFIDTHYDQLREVYRRNGHEVPFSRARLESGILRLDAANRLIAVSAFLPQSDIRIATASFFLEGDELLLWMWAHRSHYRWYRATELMTWRAMQLAIARGCRTFDLMGRGEFKTKFGAVLDESKRRWMRSASPLLTAARPVARTLYRAQQVVRGRVIRAADRVTSALRRRGAEPDGVAGACVLGDIDLVRALGLRGISSTVVAQPADAARFSRHARATLPWSDPWDAPEALVETLLRYAESQPEPPVLFYQDDASLLLVSRHRARLSHAFRFVIPEASLVEDLVDKSRFQELARRCDLPVPAARTLNPAVESCPSDLGIACPFVLKPLTRRPARWTPIAGEQKALLVDSMSRLRELWPQLAAAAIPLLAQSLVPGPETSIESYHVYVDGDGRRIADFTGRKLRTYPETFGDSSALEISSAPELTELGRELTARLRLTGVAKFDFKRRPDGGLALLEVNPRFTLWHHPAARAGLNIPALVFDDLTGRSRADSSLAARAGVRWCKVWTDHAAARARGIPFYRWALWALRCEAKRAIAWNDPMPLLEAGVRSWFARGTT